MWKNRALWDATVENHRGPDARSVLGHGVDDDGVENHVTRRSYPS